jgi:hypothetical protein
MLQPIVVAIRACFLVSTPSVMTSAFHGFAISTIVATILRCDLDLVIGVWSIFSLFGNILKKLKVDA